MADVASDLKSWSATASSNAPAGTTNIGTQLDDNLREIQKVVRQDLATKGADIASATTTDLGAVAGLMHDITGTTTITGFGTVAAGIWKIIKFEGALTLTHNATSLILPGGANITTADGDIAIMFSEGSGNWRCVSYVKASGAQLVAVPAALRESVPTIQTFTANGTYTTPANLRKARVTVVGGGGGGGGSNGSPAASGGGGSGGWAIRWLTAAQLGASQTVTIGSGGAGGISTGGNGSTGGTTSVGSLLSATGGVGGTGAVSGSASGGAGGVGSTGDLNFNGASGDWGNHSTGVGGHGGDGAYGGGGIGGATATGGAAAVYGGGGGGTSQNGGAGQVGGAGAAGVVFVEEFY